MLGESLRTNATPLSADTRPQLAEAVRVAAILGQLTLLLALTKTLRLEGEVFLRVLALATCGFAVHHFLPLGWRLPFFATLSMAGIVLVFGPQPGLAMIVIGLLVIGVCHLPVPFFLRIVLLCLAGGIMVALRANWIAVSTISSIWTVLGSMLMFRVIVYMYDLKHKAAPFGFWRATSYFFMLPNVCFPLFPVVDYKTFCRTYYNDAVTRGYQIGVTWIFRGVVQLVLYRFLYQVVQIDPRAVQDATSLIRYMVCTYLLYLHVSGTFHIIVGILRLFGFNLPETHHLYLLSASFTDFWRRINIYWKDFIQKLVFYPAYFRLKMLGPTTGMVLATLVAFTATWFLHAYQWFWLRGTWHSPIQDHVFWGTLCLLVIVNTLWESKRGRRRSLSRSKESSAWRAVGTAGKTIATFAVILLLWSFWMSDSLSEWTTMLSKASDMTWSGALLIVLVLGVIGVGRVLLGQRSREWTDAGKRQENRPLPFWRSAATVAAGSLLLIGLTREAVYERFDSDVAAVVEAVKLGKLNKLDQARLQRGYYEDLIEGARYNPAFGSTELRKPADWTRIEDTEAALKTGDFLRWTLAPMVSTTYKRARFTTNRWGMRDKDYDKIKPDDTFRVALIGESITQGLGVHDGETFESVLERRLNEELGGTDKAGSYEILNFGTEGYGPMRRLQVLEQRVFDFDPDVVWLAISTIDLRMVVWDLSHAVANGIALPYRELDEITREIGAVRGVSRVILERRLEDHHLRLLLWSYRRFFEISQSHAVRAQCVALPTTDPRSDRDLRTVIDAARKSGLEVLDLSGAYRLQGSRDTLRIAPWDGHPNAMGHRLLASELFRLLQEREFWNFR